MHFKSVTNLCLKDQSISELMCKIFSFQNLVVRCHKRLSSRRIQLICGLVLFNVFSVSAGNLSQLGFNYVVINEDRFVTAIDNDQRSIEGIVTDKSGNPLKGVSVKVKDSQIITLTDSAGVFKFQRLESTAILVFSMVGYSTEELPVKNHSTIVVSLTQSYTELDAVNVVNTGYQKIAKERSAGSFAKPNMNVVANRSTSMNILQRLDGLVPGLAVSNGSSGDPSILVRGLSTINATRSPLYVVDGIQVDNISAINPLDVEDITVLKDATAASIWGARATNGVIVITTKKGANNEKIRFSYDAFYNHQGKPDLNYYKVLTSKQFVQSFESAFSDPSYISQFSWGSISSNTNVAGIGVAPHELILYNQQRGLINASQARTSLDSLASIDNRAQIKDLLYQDAFTFNQNLAISGGFNKYAFYSSLSHTSINADRSGQNSQSYKINLRQDFTFNKAIRAFLISDIMHTRRRNQSNLSVEGGFYPYQLFKDAQGNSLSMAYLTPLYDDIRYDYENKSLVNLDYVPLDEMKYGKTNIEGINARLTGGINIKIWKGLSFDGVYGYVSNNLKSRDLLNEKSYAVRSEVVQFTVPSTTGGFPTYHLPPTGSRYTLENLNTKNWTVRNQLTYNNSWEENKHEVNVLFGQEAQEQSNTNSITTVRGFNELLQSVTLIDYARLVSTGLDNPVWGNTIPTLSVLLASPPLLEREAIVRFQSYYTNIGYTFLQKYTLNASWRIDESNLFGRDKSAQNEPVWSIGGRWNISRENFINTDNSWINNLALRTSYGVTGNAPTPGTASSFDILSLGTNYFAPGGQSLELVSPANPRLTWESTKTFNIGIDYSLLKGNRLSGTLDYYRKKTSNLIGNLEVNALTGFSVINGNMGDLTNTGIELSLTSKNIVKDNFDWSTTFVMAYNKNEITNLVTINPVATGAEQVLLNFAKGFPAFSLFAYDYAGLDNMGDPQIKLADHTITKDVNSSEAKPEDILFMGTYQPVWYGGLSNMVRYKSFMFMVNLSYNLGHVMRRDVNTFYTGRFDHENVTNYLTTFTGNIHADFANRWQNPGDELITDIPAYVPNVATSQSRRQVTNYTLGNTNVVNASYIKIRDVSLIYSLPDFINQKIKTDAISFRLQLSNLMLWKANKVGIDPEFIDPVFGARLTPLNQASITFGVNVKF